MQPGGRGIMKFDNKSVYEGQWVDGKRCGFGRLIQENGNMYEGCWKSDLANGYGVFTNLQGYRYEGNWLDDCQEGIGIETWEASKQKYVGNFSNSKKNGYGRYEWH